MHGSAASSEDEDMSTSDPTSPAPPSPTATDGFFSSVRRAGLVRTQERWIAGVGGGLARRLGIDPLVVRGIFLVSALIGGLGVVLYAIAWMLLPEESDGRIHLQELFKGHADIAVLGAAVLLVSGLTMTGGLGTSWYLGNSGDVQWWRGLVWLGIVVTVVALVVSRRDRTSPRTGHGPTTTLRPGGYGPPPPWPGSSAAPQPFFTAPTDPARSTAAQQPEGPTMSTTPMAPVPPAPGSGPASAYYPGPAQPVPPGGYGSAWGVPRGAPITALPPKAPRGPRGAGTGTFGVVVALTLIVLACLLYADRLGRLAAPVGLTTIAAAVVFLGVAIAVAGLRGRSAGGLGALAIVLMLVAAPLAGDHRYDWSHPASGTAVFGEVDARPSTVAEAEYGFDLGVGTSRIDLTALPSTADAVSVPVRIAAGEVTILVPRESDVTATVDMGAGDISWFGASTNGAGRDAMTFEHTGEGGPAGPDVALDISLGVGSLTVTEARR